MIIDRIHKLFIFDEVYGIYLMTESSRHTDSTSSRDLCAYCSLSISVKYNSYPGYIYLVCRVNPNFPPCELFSDGKSVKFIKLEYSLFLVKSIFYGARDKEIYPRNCK